MDRRFAALHALTPILAKSAESVLQVARVCNEAQRFFFSHRHKPVLLDASATAR